MSILGGDEGFCAHFELLSTLMKYLTVIKYVYYE